MKINNIIVKITLLLIFVILLSMCSRVLNKKMLPVSPPPEFPEFPLPPPEPSAVENLSDQFLNTVSKLGDVDAILISALDQNGYSRRSYFYVPNGFALVTQLERIDENGYSIPEPNRWISDITTNQHANFTLTNYIYSLFKSKPGYYRCIAFIITTASYSFSARPPTREESNHWLNTGYIKLPREIGEMNFTSDYTVMAVIYEFKKLENEETATILLPSSNSGKKHLVNSGILKNLAK